MCTCHAPLLQDIQSHFIRHQVFPNGENYQSVSQRFRSYRGKTSQLFLNLFFPIFAIRTTVLFTIRLGWPGVLRIVLVLITVPLTNLISKRKGSLIQEINVFKDKRIQITSEVIEGIRFIKLYGWEMAFRRIIQKLRELEIKNYKSLNLGRSFERALGNFVGLTSGYVMYLTAHYAGTGLDLSNIFSCMEVILSFKYSIFMLIKRSAIFA